MSYIRPFRGVLREQDVQDSEPHVRVTVVCQLDAQDPYVAGVLGFRSEADAHAFLGVLHGQVGPSIGSLSGDNDPELELYVGHLA